MKYWGDILDRFEKVSLALQSVETFLIRVVGIKVSLVVNIYSFGEILYLYEERAKKACEVNYKT